MTLSGQPFTVVLSGAGVTASRGAAPDDADARIAMSLEEAADLLERRASLARLRRRRGVVLDGDAESGVAAALFGPHEG